MKARRVTVLVFFVGLLGMMLLAGCKAAEPTTEAFATELPATEVVEEVVEGLIAILAKQILEGEVDVGYTFSLAPI